MALGKKGTREMNDYENLEKLLEKSGMDDYMMYTKEDLIEFAILAIEEARLAKIRCVNESVDNHL